LHLGIFSALPADSSSRQTADHDRVARLEINDGFQRHVEIFEGFVERPRLFGRSRKPVQNKTLPGVILREALFHEADHDRIRNEPPRFHMLLGFEAERLAGLDGLAQHVARGNVQRP